MSESGTAFALGCEALGGTDWGRFDRALASRTVTEALDRGVSVFDTADVYGLGRSEEELARALGADRHRMTIVTKGGVRWQRCEGGGRARTWRDASKSYLIEAIDASRRRLRLEALPVFLVHWPDPETPLEETLAALEYAQRSGRLVRAGLSNFPASAVEAARAAFPVSVVQSAASMLSTDGDLADLAALRRAGLTTMAYGVLEQGLLTGKYDSETVFPPDDRRHRLPEFSAAAFRRNAGILDALRTAADETGIPAPTVAIRWLAGRNAADYLVIGAKTPSQLRDNLEAVGGGLPDDVTALLDEARAERERRMDATPPPQ